VTRLLTVTIEADGSHPVVNLAGELDLSTIPQLEGQLIQQARSCPRMVVDMKGLTFIDSSGIALLLQAHRTTEDGIQTVVAEGSQVERVFRLAGIDQVLPMFGDREPAIAAADRTAAS
jgi:anti-anti-sigma factor